MKKRAVLEGVSLEKSVLVARTIHVVTCGTQSVTERRENERSGDMEHDVGLLLPTVATTRDTRVRDNVPVWCECIVDRASRSNSGDLAFALAPNHHYFACRHQDAAQLIPFLVLSHSCQLNPVISSSAYQGRGLVRASAVLRYWEQLP